MPNTNDAGNILLGVPDQATTGAIAYAPEGTTLPTTPGGSLGAAFKHVGYIDEDGVTISGLKAAGDALREWGGLKVRQLPGDADPTVSFGIIETTADALALIVGQDKVQEITANASHGSGISVKFDSDMPDIHALVIKCKDGDKRALLTFERVQVSEIEDIELTRNGAIKWKPTLAILGGANGYMNFITDNGDKTASA